MKAKFILCLLFFGLLFNMNKAKALIGSYTWTGLALDGKWNSPLNWLNLLNLPGVPGSGDIAIFNNLLIPYSVTLTSDVTCAQVISNTALSFGVGINTNGYTLNVTSELLTGPFSVSLLTLYGGGTVNISTRVDVGSSSLLYIGTPTDHSTTVNITGANVTMYNNSLTSINNYANLKFLTSNIYFGNPDVLNNYAGGTITTTGSNFYLNNSNSVINNAGTFNAGTSNFNFSSNPTTINNTGSFTATGCVFTLNGSNGSNIYNSGTFSAKSGTSFSLNSSNAIINYPSSNFLLDASSIAMTSQSQLTNYGTFTANDVSTINVNASNDSYITNYGTFNAGTSNSACTITLTGTRARLIDTAGNYNGTTYTGTFNVGSTSAIYPSASTALVANCPTCVFTLMSDQYGSATIGQVASGAYCTGIFNAQRYITGNNSLTYRSYRLLSAPVNLTSGRASVTGTNYIALNTLNSTYTVNGTKYYGAFTGGPGTGFSVVNPNPTIYFYKEQLPTSNSTFISGKNQGVKSILTNQVTLVDNNNYSIPVGNGFIMYYIGSTLNRTTGSSALKPDNATITNVGYLNQQTIPVNLWYTPTKGALKLSDASTTTYPGYNMVGNPYASTLDLKLLYNDNKDPVNGVAANFYVLNDANQQYVSYNASSGTTSAAGASQYVVSGQGFFVVANSNTSTLSFKESYKPTTVTNPTPIILSLKNLALNSTSAAQKNSSVKNDAISTPLSGLHMKLALDSVSYDECGIYYNSKWSDNFDNNDALVVGGISAKATISSLTADGYHVGINTLGNYASGKKVRVSVKGTVDGSYNIQMEDIFNIDTANYTVSLIDNFNKDSVKLVPTKNYGFTITNADTTTWGDNRFVLSIEKKALPPYQLASFTGQKATDGVLLNWKTVNEGTYTAFEVQKQGAGDGQYNAIYNVMGDGSGSYNYTDKNTVIGNNTYRLAQTDIHKNVTYSNPVTIVYNPTVAAGALSVYPNPAVAQITVNFNAATNNSAIAGPETYTASIYNINGAVVIQKSLSSNTWSPNVSDLRPGTYIVEIKSGNGSLIGNSKFTKHQ